MNASHPNILRTVAVEIKPDARKFSMISEFMANGNVLGYIQDKKANRIRLVRLFVVAAPV